jgi:PAS domain S-box-containing protein
MKIADKLNLSIFGIYILISSLVAVVAGVYTTSLVKGNIYSFLYSSNLSKAEHIRTYVQDQKKMSEMLAAASVYRDFLREPTDSPNYSNIKEKIDQRLDRTLKIDPQIFEILIIDKNGRTVASSDKTQIGNDESEDDYFIEGSKATFIKDVYEMPTTPKKTYAIASPVFDEDGKSIGVSVIRYFTDVFYQIAHNDNWLAKSEESFLINSDRYFITPSLFLGEGVIMKQKVETKNASDCFDAGEVAQVKNAGYKGLVEKFGLQMVESKDYRNVDVVATHAYIPETGWCLISKGDRSDLMAFRTNLIVIYVLVFFSGEMFVLYLGHIIFRKVTKPIETLTMATKRIEEGDYDFKTNIDTKDEVGELSKSFDKMVTVVKESQHNIQNKVKEQTRELIKKNNEVENQKNAILNILEDVEEQQSKALSLAAIIQDSEESIVGQNLNGIIISWNRGAEKLYGYKEKEAVGNSIKMIVPGDKFGEIDGIYKSIINGEILEHFQTIRKRRDGRFVPVSISVAPIKDSKDKVIGVSSMTIDITKEKEIEDAKSEFVSLAAHQLKTPVGALNWDIEMLIAGDYGKLGVKQKEVLDEMRGLGGRMNELVNDFLNISRVELGVFIVEPVPTDYIGLCEEVLREMESRRAKKGHTIVKNFDKNLPNVPADPKLMRIIFQNFISNAIKYTPDKGRITITLHADDKNLTCSVANNGNPIPEADQPKIFGKMFRASDAQEQEPDGNGLGLYLVKKIMENVGGHVWFTSKNGEDTVFSCSLPLTGMDAKEGTKKLS